MDSSEPTEQDKEKSTSEKKTIDLKALDDLNNKLDQTINRISQLEEKIEGMSPELKNATGSLNMTLAILRTFQDVTNVATIFSPSKWIMRLRPDVNLDAIERVIVDVLTREGPKNISQLTASVRMDRGTASRRIIREKVNDMIVRGILEEIDEGYGRVIRMLIDVKDLAQ
ncbi:MAG TPA: hypothetical protein VMZ29_14390 [Candidatus Bathyarchaeia archaeon]|nr:hypothetical protein [Candidatus Bathyarchaeia archaeon]